MGYTSARMGDRFMCFSRVSDGFVLALVDRNHFFPSLFLALPAGECCTKFLGTVYYSDVLQAYNIVMVC